MREFADPFRVPPLPFTPKCTAHNQYLLLITVQAKAEEKQHRKDAIIQGSKQVM